MITIAVASAKGGSTRTTSAVFLAHALHERDQRVLLVDADPRGCALDWHRHTGLPFPVIGLNSERLHEDLSTATADRYDAVVIDTPPLGDHKGIVLSALRASSHTLIPCAPTPMEFQRLTEMRAALADSADLRTDGDEPISAVLLTRAVASATSTTAHRELITEAGLPVLRGHVGRLEQFAQAYGSPITDAGATGYGDALTELLEMTTAVRGVHAVGAVSTAHPADPVDEPPSEADDATEKPPAPPTVAHAHPTRARTRVSGLAARARRPVPVALICAGIALLAAAVAALTMPLRPGTVHAQGAHPARAAQTAESVPEPALVGRANGIIAFAPLPVLAGR